VNCQFCNSPLAKDFTNLFTCGTSHPHRSRYRSTACELGEKIFKLTSERDALKARVIRLDKLGQRLNVLLCCETGYVDTEEFANSLREQQLRMIESASNAWDLETGRSKP
jgi:hypothetical protein